MGCCRFESHSVYLTYYLYDIQAILDSFGVRSGSTSHAQMGIQVLANTGLDREWTTWPMESAVPYQQVFLHGHLSRGYDLDPERAYRRYGRPKVRRLIEGSGRRIDDFDTSYQPVSFTQVLVPMWSLTVTHKSQPFQVVINGVTGEVRGQRPVSAFKMLGAMLVFLVVFVGAMAMFS